MSGEIISLPWPAKALSPNARSRSHWPRTRALKLAREAAWAFTKQAKIPKATGDKPIPLHITFCPPTKHERDLDNLIASMKAYQDGIADALGCNDYLFRSTYSFGDVVKGGAVKVMIA